MKTIYICAGGTGGHVFPAIAVFETIKAEKKFITDERGIRFTFSGVGNKEIILLKTIRFNFFSIVKTMYNFFFVLVCFLKNRPSTIVCFGSISTIIPAIVAKLFGAKVILHEQNAVMGRANRLLKFIANDVCVTYKDTEFAPNSIYTGIPIRSNIKKIDVNKKDGLVILVIGGSQGSGFFSRLMENAIRDIDEEYKRNITIFHQSRLEDLKRIRAFYAEFGIKAVVKTFFYDINEIYNKSDLVIARSGSATLSEISVLEIPSILIPFKTSSDNHQYKNAKFYADNGACILLEENNESYLKVKKFLIEFMLNKKLLLKYHDNFKKIERPDWKCLIERIV